MKKILLVLLCASSMVSAKVNKIDSGSVFKKQYKSGKAVLKLWMNGCGPCKMSEEPFEELSNELKGIKFYALEIQKDDAGLSEGVRGVPTFIVFKDGEKVDSTAGFNGKDTLKQFITGALGSADSSSAKASADKKSAEPKKKPMKKEVSKKRPAEEVIVAEEDIMIEQPKKKMKSSKKSSYGKAMKPGEVTSECVGGNCDSACSRGECGK